MVAGVTEDFLQNNLPEVIAFLCRERRFEDAYAVAEAGELAYPANHLVQLQGAIAALLAGDFELAHSKYTKCRHRFPQCEEGYSFGGMALRRMKRISEAEALLKDGLERFPDAWRLHVELAECAARDNGCNFLHQWSLINARFPDVPESYWRLTHELLLVGELDRAEEVINRGHARFPTERHILWQHAEVATRLRMWTEADKRWSNALALHPDMRELQYGYGEMKLAFSFHLSESRLEGGDTLTTNSWPAVSHGESPSEYNHKQLAAKYEGIGDNCEFGIVQRSFGIEPLGLLRWANISPVRLKEILANRFEGVGDSEFTSLNLLPGSGEYSLRDVRYFGMHTFIKAGQGDVEQVKVKMQKRLKFLVRRLLEDLETAEKIFLYKSIDCDITVEEARAIQSEIARYGTGQLLCIRRPWQGVNNRDVIKVSEKYNSDL